MNSRSRILITENVLPATGAPRGMVLQDINMMGFGGMERTRIQWEDLLEEAGLSIRRVWSTEGNLQATIEASLQCNAQPPVSPT